MSDNVIDRMFYKLGIDASDLKKQAREADRDIKNVGDQAESTKNKLNDAGKKGADAFSSVAKSALSFFAILGGTAVIKNFAKDTIETTAALGRFSQNLGLNVREVSAWGQAAEIAGGSAEGIKNLFSTISKAQTEYRLTGNTGILPYLNLLGVSLNNKKNSISDTAYALSSAFQKIAAVRGRPEAFNIGQMMGIDEGTMNLLLRGPSAIRAMVTEREKSTAITKKEADQAQRLHEQWAKIDQDMQKMSRTMTLELAPSLTKIAQAIDNLNKLTDALPIKVLGAVAAFRLLGGPSVLGAIAKLIGVASGGAAEGAAASAGIGAAGAALGAGGAMALYSQELNPGEDAWAARNRALWQKNKGSATLPTGKLSASQVAWLSSLEKQYSLPAGTLYRMTGAESSFGRHMRSPKGATGWFGFMPGTAKEMGLSSADTMDFNKSSAAAAKYLRMLTNHYHGDMNAAVAAYNFGIGNVDKGRALPAETLGYLSKVNGQSGAAWAGQYGSRQSAGSTFHIDNVTVNTKATDAQGIANDMRTTMDYMFPAQADYGLTP